MPLSVITEKSKLQVGIGMYLKLYHMTVLLGCITEVHH